MDEEKVLELEIIIQTQKEELLRYKTKLKAIVIAYTTLLKENEDLEATIYTLKKARTNDYIKEYENLLQNGNEIGPSYIQNTTSNDNMDLISMLTEELTKIELAFQNDKLVIRKELNVRDNQIKDLQNQLNEITATVKQELENIKFAIDREKNERKQTQSTQDNMLERFPNLILTMRENLEKQIKEISENTAVKNNEDVIKKLSTDLDILKKDMLLYTNNIKKFEIRHAAPTPLRTYAVINKEIKVPEAGESLVVKDSASASEIERSKRNAEAKKVEKQVELPRTNSTESLPNMKIDSQNRLPGILAAFKARNKAQNK